MTEAEFYDWLRYHKAKFSGLIRWSDNLPDEGRLADHVDELVAFVSQRYEAMHTWNADTSLNHLGGFQ